MFGETAVLPHAFLEPFIQLRVIKCTTIAAFSIVIWDYFVLLPDEVALIWPARWSLSKSLFVVNRYLAFVDPIMLIYVLLVADDAQVCATTFQALGYIATLGITFAQWILILRTYAVWGSKRGKPFFALLTVYICTLGVDFWACHRYLSGVHSNGVPAPGMTGCTLFFENRLAWAVQYFRIGGSSLMTVIYHDGLLYFACILATSITNLVVVLVAPAELHPFLIVVQRVLHSVLCSRILLHIRAVYSTEAEKGDSVRITDISPNRRAMHSNDTGSIGVRFNNSEATTSATV
ncbi:hypothetical protein BD410DRAFT_310614 [Rickenella mellea]|uniref:DUF6533 domain-containing protein n=1 Tax=Rickenella mellea TaxID=50990 RepID=A0A4Y7Q3A4_9AGAM|nr:hypothetical protein BD410DRAFT_310614 [Rickenella mellea]